jgi:hypothetical protein
MKPYCPWCRRGDLPLHLLKTHVKYCGRSPRPRGKAERKRRRYMTISNWKAFSKNTLRGFFSLTLDSGMTVHKCSLHEKNGQRWIGLPTEKYAKRDGTVAYSVLVEFTSRQVGDNFRKQVIAALEAQGLA